MAKRTNQGKTQQLATKSDAQPGAPAAPTDPSHLSSSVPPDPAFLNDVTDYFIKCWPNTPAKFFTPTCAIRKAYTSIQWYNVADALNGAPWMPKSVIISHAQISDAAINDIADVAALITLLAGQVQKTAAAWKPIQVGPDNLAGE